MQSLWGEPEKVWLRGRDSKYLAFEMSNIQQFRVRFRVVTWLNKVGIIPMLNIIFIGKDLRWEEVS